MKNVLIPVDFSDISLNAIDYAQAFFKNIPINFYLLGVYISSPSVLLGDEYNEDFLNQMDDSVSSDLNLLAEKYNKKSDFRHNYYSITMSDSLINSMKYVIKKREINLIISGTKGAAGLKETFIGSNTLKMINALDSCPILVVPNTYKFKGVHQIVFSTNYKRRFNLQELKGLIKIAIMHKSLVEVVQLISEDLLTDVQKRNKAQLQGYLEDFEFNFNKLDWKDSETKTIQNHVQNTNSELLTLINHKYNFFKKLTEENVIKKVSFHSPIPILILPEVN